MHTIKSLQKKIRKIGKAAVWAGVFVFLCGILVVAYFAKDLPDPTKIDKIHIAESTKILDRTGQVVLYDIHGEERRTIVPFDQISQYAKDATVAVEDANFYNHFGLDFKGIMRAAIRDLIGRERSQGGSTITQQFIKKSLLSDEKTFTRKIKEAILSIGLETKYSKDEILGFYLNQIPYGSNAYGIEEASKTFFNKSAKDLTLAESALLASLPQAPSFYSPYGSHPEDLKARQEYVLDRMAQLGYISQKEANAAKEEELKFSPQARTIKAPHFVMYIKEYLENKYGRDYVQTAGLEVYTTLDWELQEMAEKLVAEGAASNWKKYRAYNAALTAVDPKTGQILVMVGSRDYFDTEHDGNVNVAVRDRQPGSSFKPFAYAKALQEGYTPETIVYDLRTEFNPNCPADGLGEKDQYGLDCYNPNNYDGKFRGPISLREALAQSLNIPAVKTLYLAGISDTINLAKKMGITGLNSNYYGLSLVLGGGEVKLLDEVAAYGVFANDGVKNEKTAILKIVDNKGKVIEEYSNKSERVLDAETARKISDILSDNQARSPVFGSNSSLYFPERQVAAKTGTTEKYRDAWTVGYTPSLAAGIWVGNNNNTPMSAAGAGIAAAGPIWHSFIKKAYELKAGACEKEDVKENSFCFPKDPENFTKPQAAQIQKAMLNGSYMSEQTYKINKITGALADDLTPPEFIEEKNYKQAHCILYYVDKNNPRGEYPQNPASDEQFKNWEAAVAYWVSQQNETLNQVPPEQADPNSPGNESNLPQIQITSPSSGQVIDKKVFFFKANVSAPLGVKQVDFFINNEFVGSALSAPYEIFVVLPKDIEKGPVLLKARAYDKVLNRQEAQISVFIKKDEILIND